MKESEVLWRWVAAIALVIALIALHNNGGGVSEADIAGRYVWQGDLDNALTNLDRRLKNIEDDLEQLHLVCYPTWDVCGPKDDVLADLDNRLANVEDDLSQLYDVCFPSWEACGPDYKVP